MYQVSDYEDIWGPESLSTFKPRSNALSPSEEQRRVPELEHRRVPDILDRVPPCPAPRPSLIAPHPSPVSPNEPKTPTEQVE